MSSSHVRQKCPPSRNVPRFSARGLEAIRRGLATLETLSESMGIPMDLLVKAPKAEWHHDMITGNRIWLYDPEQVLNFMQGAVFKAAERRARSLRNTKNRLVLPSASSRCECGGPLFRFAFPSGLCVICGNPPSGKSVPSGMKRADVTRVSTPNSDPPPSPVSVVTEQADL